MDKSTHKLFKYLACYFLVLFLLLAFAGCASQSPTKPTSHIYYPPTPQQLVQQVQDDKNSEALDFILSVLPGFRR